MKNLLKLWYFALFILVISANAYSKETNDKTYKNAIVKWTGAHNVDGCEWMISINGKLYKASNLQGEYAVDGLKVKLIYEEDAEYKYYCGDNPIPQQAIRIIEIEMHHTYRSYFGAEFTRWYVFHNMIDCQNWSCLYYANNQDTLLSNGINYKKVYTANSLVNWNPYYNFGIREEPVTGSLFVKIDGVSEILVSRMDLELGDKFYFPSTSVDFDGQWHYFSNVKKNASGNKALKAPKQLYLLLASPSAFILFAWKMEALKSLGLGKL